MLLFIPNSDHSPDSRHRVPESPVGYWPGRRCLQNGENQKAGMSWTNIGIAVISWFTVTHCLNSSLTDSFDKRTPRRRQPRRILHPTHLTLWLLSRNKPAESQQLVRAGQLFEYSSCSPMIISRPPRRKSDSDYSSAARSTSYPPHDLEMGHFPN